MDRVGDDVVAEVVGLSVDGPGPDSAPCHPDGGAARVVVAAVVVRRQLPLRVASSAELAAPDDQRVLQETAALEVEHQGCGGAVGLLALLPDRSRQVAMLVPALVVELDEAHVALEESAGEQAVGGVGPGGARVLSVQGEGLLRLSGEVRDLGDRALHTGGELVLSDPPEGLGRAIDLVQAAQSVEHARARGAVDAGRVSEVEHGVRAGSQLDALVASGQEPRAPQSLVERLPALVLGDQHAELGEVRVPAAESVAEPGTHRGPPRALRAGLDEGHRRVVVDRLGGERADDAELVHDLRRLGQELADPGPALAVLGEGELAACEREARLVAAHPGQPLTLAHAVGELLAVALLEDGLVVEEVDLGGASALEEVDDPLGLRRVVQAAREERGVLRSFEEGGEPGGREPRARCPQQLAA